MLRDLKCDAVQGFLYGRPMPPDVLEQWLQERALHSHSGVTVLHPRTVKKVN
jgi:sensor c-di-GMP phosphodiesterase-like protein